VAFKEALSPEFTVYQKQVKVNASAMADLFIERGYNIVSGGTDNHLFLVDLVDKGLTGKVAEAALEKANITTNKNSVPNDPQSPFVTSGIRLGAPAITTRGFTEQDSKDLAGWMCDILDDVESDAVQQTVKQNVLAICKRLPVYAD